ncbi:hypothetical protein BN1723_019917, partial [Verticillium longisporum]
SAYCYHWRCLAAHGRGRTEG